MVIWVILATLFLLGLAFVITLIIITLIMVGDIQSKGLAVDPTELAFVQVGNWILVALLAIFVIGMLALSVSVGAFLNKVDVNVISEKIKADHNILSVLMTT
jgi:uncharacterized membrane protein YjgN (DUF898 family)